MNPATSVNRDQTGFKTLDLSIPVVHNRWPVGHGLLVRHNTISGGPWL